MRHSRQKVVASSIINNEILRRKFVGRHPQSLAIGDELDGAVFIRAINVVLTQSVNQSLHYVRAGMTKGIICSDANHGHFGTNSGQKLRGSGCIAAVIGDLGD